jgi:hypothetical protein
MFGNAARGAGLGLLVWWHRFEHSFARRRRNQPCDGRDRRFLSECKRIGRDRASRRAIRERRYLRRGRRKRAGRHKWSRRRDWCGWQHDRGWWNHLREPLLRLRWGLRRPRHRPRELRRLRNGLCLGPGLPRLRLCVRLHDQSAFLWHGLYRPIHRQAQLWWLRNGLRLRPGLLARALRRGLQRGLPVLRQRGGSLLYQDRSRSCELRHLRPHLRLREQLRLRGLHGRLSGRLGTLRRGVRKSPFRQPELW